MKFNRFILISLALIGIQACLMNFIDFSQFVSIFILPAIIICLPLNMSSSLVLVIAFAVGLAVDFCSDGALGLTTCALLPVAWLRRTIIEFVCGEEVFSRGESVSIRRQGIVKVTVTLAISTAIFLLIYIWADGAGMRPFWFNLARFTASLIVSTLASLLCMNILSENH